MAKALAFTVIFFLSLVFSFSSALALSPRPKLIIGTDERIPILDTKLDPYWRIGQIGDFCTGSLIAPDVVLTAAHCVADIYNPYLNFAPARLGKLFPVPPITWKQIVVPTCYQSEEARICDYAFIFLAQSISGIQTFNLQGNFDSSSPVSIIGYPSDKENTMWRADCPATLDQQRLFYSCDTLGGMSGSPIIQQTEGTYRIVGIHTRGEEEINSGVLRHERMAELFAQAQEVLTGNQASLELTVFENPYLPQFEKAHSSVSLKNNCNQQIVAKVLYKDIRGNMAKKMRIIGKNSSKLLDQVYGPEVYLTFQTKSGDFISSGNELCGYGAAWPHCFNKYPINLELPEQELELHCP